MTSQLPREQLLAEFRSLEEAGRGGSKFSRLFPFFDAGDMLIQIKAFLTLGRTGNGADGLPLLALLQEPALPYVHLLALDAYQALPLDPSVRVAQLATVAIPTLHPTVQRGFLWVLGHTVQPAALDLLADFVVGSGAWGIKDDFLNEQWFVLAGGFPQEAAALAEARPALARWLCHRLIPAKPCYGLYPAPDYLWQIAKKTGVIQADFRQIYYYPRQKQRGK